MVKTTRIALKLLLVVVLVSASALAESIDFAGFPGGSMSFTPTTGQSLSVTNAPINMLFLLSSPGNPYYFSPSIGDPATGYLSFNTGAATSVESGTIMCPGTCATFGADSDPSTPDLSITGTVYKQNPDFSRTAIASGTLLSGSFINGSAQFANGIGSLQGLFNISYMSPTLLTSLLGGVPEGSMTGTIGQVYFNVNLNDQGSFNGMVGSTNIVAKIPEPANLFLMGLGLFLGGGLIRRKAL